MSILFLRAQQQHQQVRAIGQLTNNRQLVSYDGRDSVSGNRILRSADGGTIRATWLSENEPDDKLYNVSNPFGVPDYVVSK